MKYAQLCSLREEGFKRYTGVSRSSFALMVEVMQARERAKKKSGRPSALCLEDQILMTLNYWREYRTQFHLGVEYGISDGTVSKIIRLPCPNAFPPMNAVWKRLIKCAGSGTWW